MTDFETGLTELASLFLIVFLVYVLQCICWASPRAIVFALGIRGRGKRRYQGFVWNAFDTSGVVANPLPPLSPLLVVQWPAFELTPDCIQFAAKEGEPVSIPWEKLKLSHSESKLLCNESVAFKGSEAQVLQYVELLGQLRRARRTLRAQLIQDWLRRMTNTQAAARRLLVFSRRSCWLRIVSNLQFVFLFLLVPLAFEKFGTGILWRVIVMLVVISIAITLEFWTLHKGMFPQAGGQRFKSGLTILLSPMAAIRANDAVARDLLSGYHPVAVAGAVLPAEEFQRFAGEQLRLCCFGDYLDKQYQQALQKAMEKIIRQKQLDPEELMRPPDKDSGCVVYCPRCLAQYTKQREACTDCGYEGLALFDRAATRTYLQ